MLLSSLFVARRLRDSRLGRAWVAVREDEIAAAMMGVNPVRTKLLAFALGACFAGVAGAFPASYSSTVNLDSFDFSFSVLVLIMVILGGIGNIWGAVLGAFVLTCVDRYLLPRAHRRGGPAPARLRRHADQLS